MKHLAPTLLFILLLAAVATAQPPAPSNLTASHDGNGLVDLSWNAPPIAGQSWVEFIGWPTQPGERDGFMHPNFQEARAAWNALNATSELDEFLHYRIYRDGAQIGTSTTTSFTHQLGSPGTYVFTVTAFYDEGESNSSNEAEVVWYDPDNWLILEDFDDGLPDTWTIESHSATHSWHVDNGGEWGLFNTPYMLIDADEAGSCSHLMERLITPMLDFENADYGEVTFSFVFNEYIEEHGYVDVRIDGGPWQEVFDITDDFLDIQTETLDLSDWVLDEEEAEVSFYYDDLGNWGWYWGIDDVQVYRGGTVYPVILDITPTQTTVPPDGGSVVFDVEIENTLGQAFTDTQVWTTVTTPSGNEIGPIFSMPFPVSPFMQFFYIGFVQPVPAGAPGGSYTYTVHLGYPQGFALTESFPFTKLGATAADGDWQAQGLWQPEPRREGMAH